MVLNRESVWNWKLLNMHPNLDRRNKQYAMQLSTMSELVTKQIASANYAVVMQVNSANQATAMQLISLSEAAESNNPTEANDMDTSCCRDSNAETLLFSWLVDISYTHDNFSITLLQQLCG